LDLRGIEHRHEPDPQFRAALQRRLASIVAGSDPGSVTEARDLATIDLEPTHARSAPRRSRRRVAQVILAAAAAVVAIAVVATRDGDDAAPADQPSPTVTVTVPPRALFGTDGEMFVPGTYFVDRVAGTATPRIFVTLGEGWGNMGDGWAIGGGAGYLMFSRPERVWLDASCARDGFHPGPVTTLDGLVAALSEQRGWINVTAPTAISVSGYPGKTFQRTAPASFSGCNTGGLNDPDVTRQAFRSWVNGDPIGGWSSYEPGEIETLRVLDVNGTIILINTRTPDDRDDPAAAALAAAVLDSIRIEQT
jgi:hypothetical protein